MTLKELKQIVKDLPDDTLIKVLNAQGDYKHIKDVKIDNEKDIPWPDPLDRSEIKDSKEKCDQKFKDGIRYIQG